MTKFKNKYRIESSRLKNYDYSSDGAYFITICTKGREHFFGEIADGKLQETDQSKICMECWLDLPNHYSNCILDAFVIMPNHVHGIVFIENRNEIMEKFISAPAFVPAPAPVSAPVSAPVETGFKPVSTNANANANANAIHKIKQYSISEIMRGFKTFTARKINDLRNTQGISFWQSRFHDRIIRNEKELNRIREYISSNLLNWEKDCNKK